MSKSRFDITVPKVAGVWVSLLRVDMSSPISHRKAVWKIAQFFQREFDYSFVQYGHKGRESDPDHVAWLWLDHNADVNATCVGATCFRKREEAYGLQWVWFHPYVRRRGLLSEAWPMFRTEFGQFDVEPPLSKAMRSFLEKHP